MDYNRKNGLQFFAGRGCDELEFRDLENGSIKRPIRGAVVTFECDDNYVLEGSATIVCDGQKWNDTKPQCLSKLMLSFGYCNQEHAMKCF